jgi:hypothetical protein
LRFITIILAILAANPALSKTLLLECKVTGEASVIDLAGSRGSVSESKLDPATITVQVEESGKLLFIGIDGPADYRLGLTSVPGVGIKVMSVTASENTFALNTQDTSDPKSEMTGNIWINRKTGAIIVTKYFSVGDYYRNISYSGSCQKLSRTTNKF